MERKRNNQVIMTTGSGSSRKLSVNLSVLLGFLVMFCWCFFFASSSFGTDANNQEETSLTSQQEQTIMDDLFKTDDVFLYQSEGRPDPFMPFITEKIVLTESKAAEEELTGMQKFEPGQLSLVAIVFQETEPFAMVQDSVGMGYIIRKGTKIGRSGEVEDILPNVVMIKELIVTQTRQERYKTIEMILRKEGDK